MEIDTLLKVLLPSVGALVGILVLILKYYRPIYYLFSNKYNKTTISDSGELVELSIRNFGLNVENNIKLEVANNLVIYLITNMEGVTIQNNIIKVDRINSASVTNILILVEGGTFSKDSIVYAKTDEKDIDYKQTPETRYSYLQVIFVTFVILFAILSIGVLGYFFGETSGRYEAEMRHIREKIPTNATSATSNINPEIIRRTARLEALGWQSLDDRIFSDKFFSEYGDEFPIKLVNVYIKNGVKYFDFEATNKLSEFFEVQVSTLKSFNSDEAQARIPEITYWRGPVLPSAKARFSLRLCLPAKNDDQTKYIFKFYIQTKENLYTFILVLDG